MITLHAQSRLGNQLYQFGVTLAMALKHNTEAGFPDNAYSRYFPKLKTIPESYRVSTFYNENGAGYQDIPYTPDMCLVGYFQSYKYWDWCRDYILEQFDFKNDTNYGCCSIHIRRGDYLEYPDKHPQPPKEYFDKAMQFMAEKNYSNFIVFGDDKVWNESNFNSDIYPNYTFEYSTIEDPYEDLRFMSSCENNIITNSTYSIWAAELNKNPDKVVISPAADNYYGPSHRDQDVKDLLRPEWHKIAW